MVVVKLGSCRRQRNSMPLVALEPIIVSTREGSAAAVPCVCRKRCERSVLEGVCVYVYSCICYTAALSDNGGVFLYMTHSCPQLLRAKLGQPALLFPSYRPARQKEKG